MPVYSIHLLRTVTELTDDRQTEVVEATWLDLNSYMVYLHCDLWYNLSCVVCVVYKCFYIFQWLNVNEPLQMKHTGWANEAH